MRAYAFYLLVIAVLASVAATPGSAAADEDFSIVINGRTGEAFLRNDASASLELDGYLVRSPTVDVFDPASWSSLHDNPATPGWTESLAAGNRLGEANLFGSTSLAPGGTLSLGSPYLPFAPTAVGEPEPGIDSIEFTYSLATGGAPVGDVEFISRNTVVLVVDPITGAASLDNQSAFDVNIDSYLIQSAPAVLDVEAWTPLAVSLGGGGGWVASTGAINRIAEGNLFGSSFLAANGGSLSIGSPIDPSLLDDETDLSLEFTVAGVGSIAGGVLFAAAAPALPGDYNGNGMVDAADYTVWRDRLGQSFALTNENPAATTPGLVDQEDYVFWKSRFGAAAGSSSGGTGGGSLASSAVPEPSAGMLACVFGLWVVGRRCSRPRRRELESGTSGIR